MEFSEIEVCKEPGKKDTRGRRVLGKQRWLQLLSLYDESGLTQKEFCRREGVNYTTFISWVGKRKRGWVGSANSGSRGKEELRGLKAASYPLEVVLSSGVVLRGDDAGQLAGLVLLLEGGRGV